jgi:hypothetical protein
MPCVIPLKGNLRQRQAATPRQRASPAEPSYRVPLGWFLKGLPSLVLHVARLVSSKKNTSLKLHPFATTDAFGSRPLVWTGPDVVTVFSSTRLPGFSGRDFLTTTGSSATSHRVSAFLSCLLKSPTDPTGVTSVAGQCQASPVTVLAPC